MSTNETAALRCTGDAARDERPEPAKILDHLSRSDSTATHLGLAALALPVGVGGYLCTPSGEWYDLWRESAGVAHARRVTEDEVRDGLLAEARFLKAEPLGGVA